MRATRRKPSGSDWPSESLDGDMACVTERVEDAPDLLGKSNKMALIVDDPNVKTSDGKRSLKRKEEVEGGKGETLQAVWAAWTKLWSTR